MDAPTMFLVVVALYFLGKVMQHRCFWLSLLCFLEKMMHHRCFWSCKISGDGSPWGVAAILRAKIMDGMDANATVQNRPKSLELSKYSGR